MTRHQQSSHDDHQGWQHKLPIALLLNDIEDPLNVGSIFRLSDALGVEKVYLTGNTPTTPNRKISRTSRAADKYINFEYIESADEALALLRSQGYGIVALELTNHSVDLGGINYSQFDYVCLILGGENHGIKASLLNDADYVAHIPMLGANSSINVSMAAAIAVYEIGRGMRK